MANRHERRPAALRPTAENLEDRIVQDATSGAYIGTVYQDVLHRAATVQEVTYWSQQIKGGRSPVDLARGLIAGGEHRTAEINADYQLYLHRSPSASEQSYYLNAFARGQTSDSVILSMLAAPEYQQLHPGTTNYVNALYNDVLGRDADAGGMALYTSELNSGMSPATVAFAFLHSPEREGQVVDLVYASTLRRVAKPVERQYQVDLLAFGNNTTENLTIGALASPETIRKFSTTG